MDLSQLTPKERLKYEVAKDVVELGISDTAIRRGRVRLECTRKSLLKYVDWYNSGDISKFSHKNKNRQPATTIAPETKEFIETLYKEKYSTASFTHFVEILKEDYGIKVSDRTIHTFLKGALLISPCSKRATRRQMEKNIRHMARKANLTKNESENVAFAYGLIDGADAHPRRPRSKYFGELIQMDASEYIWVKGQPKWHLHAAIDDATSEIVGAWFDTQETLNGYYNVLYMILKLYGVPNRFLTDRRTVFEYTLLAKPDEEKDTYTQFTAACKTLGIEMQCSSVPQVKGRIERLNRTLQGRLPVEFVRNNITTIEEANAFLWEYLPRFNAQFSLKEDQDLKSSTFIEAPSEEDINIILAVVSQRIVDDGHCIKYHNNYYQLFSQDQRKRSPMFFGKGTKVLVIKAFDGTLLGSVKDQIYILKKLEQRLKTSKEFDPAPAKEKKPYKPADDHPWKRSRYLSTNFLEPHISQSKEYIE